MLENVVSRRVTLQAYNFEVFGDEITFSASTETNGNNTWNGLSTPAVVAFEPAENGPAVVVGVRSIYFNGSLQVDGLTATFAYSGMRIVDPVYLHNGSFADWPPFQGVGGSLSVDWGDGTTPDSYDLSDEAVDLDPQHVYAEAGTYTVTATASFTDTLYSGAPTVTLDLVVVEP